MLRAHRRARCSSRRAKPAMPMTASVPARSSCSCGPPRNTETNGRAPRTQEQQPDARGRRQSCGFGSVRRRDLVARAKSLAPAICASCSRRRSRVARRTTATVATASRARCSRPRKRTGDAWLFRRGCHVRIERHHAQCRPVLAIAFAHRLVLIAVKSTIGKSPVGSKPCTASCNASVTPDVKTSYFRGAAQGRGRFSARLARAPARARPSLILVRARRIAERRSHDQLRAFVLRASKKQFFQKWRRGRGGHREPGEERCLGPGVPVQWA